MEIKPGQKTSELIFSALVVGIIVGSEQVGVTLTGEQITALTIIAVTYSGGRSILKTLLPFLSGVVQDKVSNVVNTTVAPADSPKPPK